MYYKSNLPSYSEKTQKQKRRSRSRQKLKQKDDKKRGSNSSDSDSKDNVDIKSRKKNVYDDKWKRKRIRFQKDEELQHIRIFKKQDQPNSKPMTEADVAQYKLKLEYEHKSIYSKYFDSQELKHHQSLMEGKSMKEFKQKERSFNDKILLTRQQMQFYPPPLLKYRKSEVGVDSLEKQSHTQRISSTLGCNYLKYNDIPDEPNFSNILNNKQSQEPPKNIAFEKPTEKDHFEIMKFVKAQDQKKKQLKPLKGIMKKSPQQLRKFLQKQLIQKNKIIHQSNNYIDPQFLKIYKDISTNKSIYSSDQLNMLLKPFKDNGTLEIYLKKLANNKAMPNMQTDPNRALSILQDLNKKQQTTINNYMPQLSNPIGIFNPNNIGNLGNQNPPPIAFGQNSIQANKISPNINANQFSPMQGSPMNMMNVVPMKTQKYKTVPCKYYHGIQGCERKTDCTFIHDEAYAGKPTPNMHRYVKGIPQQTPVYNTMNPMNNNLHMFANYNVPQNFMYSQQPQLINNIGLNNNMNLNIMNKMNSMNNINNMNNMNSMNNDINNLKSPNIGESSNHMNPIYMNRMPNNIHANNINNLQGMQNMHNPHNMQKLQNMHNINQINYNYSNINRNRMNGGNPNKFT